MQERIYDLLNKPINLRVNNWSINFKEDDVNQILEGIIIDGKCHLILSSNKKDKIKSAQILITNIISGVDKKWINLQKTHCNDFDQFDIKIDNTSYILKLKVEYIGG